MKHTFICVWFFVSVCLYECVSVHVYAFLGQVFLCLLTLRFFNVSAFLFVFLVFVCILASLSVCFCLFFCWYILLFLCLCVFCFCVYVMCVFTIVCLVSAFVSVCILLVFLFCGGDSLVCFMSM